MPDNESQGSPTSQLRDTAQQTAENIKNMGGQVRDAAVEQYENIRDAAGNYYQQGRETVNEWRGSVEDYVLEKPIKSLLIAAGVGMLFGVLWRRS